MNKDLKELTEVTLKLMTKSEARKAYHRCLYIVGSLLIIFLPYVLVVAIIQLPIHFILKPLMKKADVLREIVDNEKKQDIKKASNLLNRMEKR